jgi:hypothetical protein
VKLPFSRTDPDETLKAAEAALAQAESKIADLERDRAAKLLELDYTAGVESIDLQISAHRRAAVVHRDRLAAMLQKRRTDDRARLEREKADGIADIGKRLARRDSAAQRLEAALADVSAVFAELSAADEATFTGWHAVLPAPNTVSYLSIGSMATLCRRDRRPSDFDARVIVGSVRSIAEGAAEGLAAEVQQKGRDLLEILQAEPIPDDVDEEAAA